jgi:hypothetical protein
MTDVNEIRNTLERLDALPTGALSTIMMALAFNKTAPVSVRTSAIVTAKRLSALAEIELPAGSRVVPLNSDAAATIAHSLRYYEESEADCTEHFRFERNLPIDRDVPSNTEVESLTRLIESSDLYVVVRDFEAFDSREDAFEAAEDAIQAEPGPNYPEDPQVV